MTEFLSDAITTVRAVEGEERTITGIAVPYGMVARDTEIGPEAFAPGAFRASVDHWNGRTDGARMAFRPAHKERPIGTVVGLEDTPAGVVFRAVIKATPEGDAYLSDVRDGLNGISAEIGLDKGSRRSRDGTTVHRSARLHALAGSVSPAYDAARIALRDMEESPMPEEIPAADAVTTDQDAHTDVTPAERSRLELADVQTVLPTPIQITRQESVYGPGREHSFLRDLHLSHHGDTAAAERQARHGAMMTDVSTAIERAGDVLSSEIPGAYPNDYLPGLLTPRILKGRPMGGFYQRVPISDARPKIFAKVTTSSAVAVQSAEGAALSATDIATTAVTATPLMYGAYLDVSRQVLDGSDPSAQSMIMQDLVESYAQASETVIKTAVEAGSSASGTAITAATPYAGTLGNVIAYQAARFTPARAQFVPSALYAVLLAQGDTAGRPFLAFINPTNSDGTVRDGGTGANILGADTYLSWASTTNVVVTGRASDFVIYESSVATFSYSEIVGPQAIRLGLWAYLVVGTRLGSLKVTAA